MTKNSLAPSQNGPWCAHMGCQSEPVSNHNTTLQNHMNVIEWANQCLEKYCPGNNAASFSSRFELKLKLTNTWTI
jgi:hypothetical protein